jgi:hypothetical protein
MTPERGEIPMSERTAQSLRDQLETRIGSLADHTDELRHQVINALPDKDQLLDLRDNVFEKLPADVQDRMPESVKPKKSKLRKVATLGVVAAAAAGVVAVFKSRSQAPAPYTSAPAFEDQDNPFAQPTQASEV